MAVRHGIEERGEYRRGAAAVILIALLGEGERELGSEHGADDGYQIGEAIGGGGCGLEEAEEERSELEALDEATLCILASYGVS